MILGGRNWKKQSKLYTDFEKHMERLWAKVRIARKSYEECVILAMDAKIIDTSVIVKWFVDEEDSDKAKIYLEDFKNRKISIIVPNLMFYELGNVLLSKKASKRQSEDIINFLNRLRFEVIDFGRDAFGKIFQTAQEMGITFYDASYVTLSITLSGSELVTSDRKLYDKLHGKFSSVKLL